MALSRKSSRMLKQLMTTLKDEIYDADSPHMQREKEEQIRNPEHVIQRQSRSGRCLGNPRFRSSYTPRKKRVRVVMTPEPETESSSEEVNGNGNEEESSEEETNNDSGDGGNEFEEEESSNESDIETAMENETESINSPRISMLKQFGATVRRGNSGGSFLKLPFELRAKVYKDLLCVPGGVHIRPISATALAGAPVEAIRAAGFEYLLRNPQESGADGLHVEILRTCTLIHAEAMAILYGQNSFQIDDLLSAIPFFESLSSLARLLMEHVEICHNRPRGEYLHTALLEREPLSGELVFMQKRWESTLFYLAANFGKLKKLDISSDIFKDDYQSERAKMAGAIVRCHDKRYAWEAEFGDLRLENKSYRDHIGVIIEVKLKLTKEKHDNDDDNQDRDHNDLTEEQHNDDGGNQDWNHNDVKLKLTGKEHNDDDYQDWDRDDMSSLVLNYDD